MKLLLSVFAIILTISLGACSKNTVPPTETTQYSQNLDETNSTNTYDKKSIINAASDFLGAGSEAIAKVVEKAFKDHGRPDAYILGTEVSAALIVGVRYGDGTLSHKIEGDSRIYWTGPSLGIDVGADGSRVFALVYNLYDVKDIYHRYPAVEGSFYFVGGVGMNYQQRGNVIIAPIRVGVGLRAGVNLGYLRFTKKRTWLPF